MVNLKLRVYELLIGFFHCNFEISGLRLHTDPWPGHLRLLAWLCSAWVLEKTTHGSRCKSKKVTKTAKGAKKPKISPQRFPLASNWRRPDHQAVTAGWDYLSCLIFSQWSHIGRIASYIVYDSVADVPESGVWLRVDFQSGSRVLKKVFWTFFLSISMAYNVISCQKVAENTQILKIAKFAM